MKYTIIENDEYGDNVIVELYNGNERVARACLEFRSYLPTDLTEIEEEKYNVLFPDDKYAELTTLEVNGSYKGKGYGKKIMRKALSYIKKREYLEVYLNACPLGFEGLSLYNLVKFYEKFGFRTFIEEARNQEMALSFR